ncbi:hypothetical protein WHZ77_15155 [Bradyrhizobium sp. A5]|uniref:hypothetical protein n=1 Tax=Bradyrhizobium sp. A5 TaxID=3133696 RepID=UPI00324F2FF0
MVEFLKREEAFWSPLNKLEHRSRLYELVAISRKILAPTPLKPAEQVQTWLRLIQRTSELPWLKGAQLRTVCLRIVWLFSPETVVRWDDQQCSGLMRFGLPLKGRERSKDQANSFVNLAAQAVREHHTVLQWSAEAGAALNGGEVYPFPAFIFDRLLVFASFDKWRKADALSKLLQDDLSRDWFVSSCKKADEVLFSVRA